MCVSMFACVRFKHVCVRMRMYVCTRARTHAQKLLDPFTFTVHKAVGMWLVLCCKYYAVGVML